MTRSWPPARTRSPTTRRSAWSAPRRTATRSRPTRCSSAPSSSSSAATRRPPARRSCRRCGSSRPTPRRGSSSHASRWTRRTTPSRRCACSGPPCTSTRSRRPACATTSTRCASRPSRRRPRPTARPPPRPRPRRRPRPSARRSPSLLRKMRLLAVCQVDRPGGPEIGLVRFLRRLEHRGWEIAITSPGEEPTPLADQGWPWEPLEVGGLAHGAGARAVASWPRARRLSRDADITYLNGTVAGRLLPALRGHATVLHVHDIVDRVPRHWHGADLVLADSKAVGARLDPLDVHVIGCPVELDAEPLPAPWPEHGGPVVGFVGRLVPRKGALDLVRAAPAIRAARPDVRVVVVGDDPYDDE